MKTLIPILLIFLLIDTATAQNAQRVKNFNIDKTTLAIEGYDPVAYFVSKKELRAKRILVILGKVLPIIFRAFKTGNCLKLIPQNMSLNMAAGVPMQWAKKAIKYL